MEDWLPKLFDTYSPRLVYFQAGVDALAFELQIGRASCRERV